MPYQACIEFTMMIRSDWLCLIEISCLIINVPTFSAFILMLGSRIMVVCALDMKKNFTHDEPRFLCSKGSCGF